MNVVSLQQEIDLGEPQFDDWWILWLKKVKRKESKRLWMRLRNEQKMESIIAAAEWRPIWLAREEEFRPEKRRVLGLCAAARKNRDPRACIEEQVLLAEEVIEKF